MLKDATMKSMHTPRLNTEAAHKLVAHLTASGLNASLATVIAARHNGVCSFCLLVWPSILVAFGAQALGIPAHTSVKSQQVTARLLVFATIGGNTSRVAARADWSF